jgi:WD40 repeat protein
LGPDGLAAARGRLLDGFTSERMTGWIWAAADPYLALTLPDHLDATGRHGELHDLLTNLDWLEARLANGTVHDLIRDYRHADDELTRDIGRALLRSANAVALDKSLLRSQLISRLSGHPNGDISEWAAALRAQGSPNVTLLSVTPALGSKPDSVEQILNHPVDVNSVAITPDGRLALTGAKDGVMRVWDLSTGSCTEFEGHHGEVGYVSISADGNLAASTGSHGHEVFLWDLTTGSHQKLKYSSYLTGPVAISADGSRVIAGDWKGRLCAWDTRTGAETELSSHTDQLGTYEGNHNSLLPDTSVALESVAIAADGMTAVTGTGHGAVLAWNLVTGNHSKPIRHGHTIAGVAITPDASRVAFVTYEGVVQIWDLSGDVSSEIDGDYRGRGGTSRGIAFTADGKKLFIGNNVWDIATRHRKFIREAGSGPIAVSADGLRAVSVNHSAVLVLNLLEALPGRPDEQPGIQWPVHGGVVSTSFTLDGNLAVSGSLGSRVQLWDMKTCKCISLKPPLQEYPLYPFALALEGSRVLFASSSRRRPIGVPDMGYAKWFAEDDKLLLWDVATGVSVDYAPLERLNSAAFDIHANRVIWCSEEEIGELDLGTDVRRSIAKTSTTYGGRASITLDGRHGLVISDYYTRANLWDLTSNRSLEISGWSGPSHTPRIEYWIGSFPIAIDKANTRALIGVWHGLVRLLDLSSGTLRELTSRHSTWVNSVSMSADGAFAVSGDLDGIIQVWDLNSVSPIAWWFSDTAIQKCIWVEGGKPRIAVVPIGGTPYVLSLEI